MYINVHKKKLTNHSCYYNKQNVSNMQGCHVNLFTLLFKDHVNLLRLLSDKRQVGLSETKRTYRQSRLYISNAYMDVSYIIKQY